MTTLAPRRAWTLAMSDTAVMTRRYLYHYLRKPSLLGIALVQPVLSCCCGPMCSVAPSRPRAASPMSTTSCPACSSWPSPSARPTPASSGRRPGPRPDRPFPRPPDGPALLVGRTLADTARNTFVVLLMVAVGYAVGFRFHAGPAAALAALVLPLAVGYLLSWISALIGLTVRDPETAGTASLLPVIPLAFTSSAFVPVATMPGWLQPGPTTTRSPTPWTPPAPWPWAAPPVARCFRPSPGSSASSPS